MKKIRMLLLTGANNHDWKRSSPFVKELLESSGYFTIDTSEHPSDKLAVADELRNYDLFFLDYNGPDWGEPAKANFTEAVRKGAGTVFLHASNNCFQDWEAYNQMLGLRWMSGVSGHGAFHEFEVELDPEHPITKGIAPFKTWDELYHRLQNPTRAKVQVIATAYSDPEQRGTGEREPIMLVQEFGEGKIFHIMLGHVWKGDPLTHKGSSLIALENPGFQKCLVRGCEWAATGRVRSLWG